jgi:hypothetical protein
MYKRPQEGRTMASRVQYKVEVELEFFVVVDVDDTSTGGAPGIAVEELTDTLFQMERDDKLPKGMAGLGVMQYRVMPA